VEDFWLKYSSPPSDAGSIYPGDRVRFKWTKILKMLRQQKKNVDAVDMERARDKYGDGEAFIEHFSYRKGNRMLPLKNPAHIARRLRKIEGNPQFWDYTEEETAEAE